LLVFGRLPRECTDEFEKRQPLTSAKPVKVILSLLTKKLSAGISVRALVERLGVQPTTSVIRLMWESTE
jgi:hypothetical protein